MSERLDKAIDTTCGYKPTQSKAESGGKDNAARVAFLFTLYQQIFAPLVEVVTIKSAEKVELVVAG